ncbi:Uncharacterised protein [Chlamydia abortus]|nr:Uncharacterised protein [Chlamydia abortus]SGA22816.1 Uncharacterised protein [Chlamydia abortus]
MRWHLRIQSPTPWRRVVFWQGKAIFWGEKWAHYIWGRKWHRFEDLWDRKQHPFLLRLRSASAVPWETELYLGEKTVREEWVDKGELVCTENAVGMGLC